MTSRALLPDRPHPRWPAPPRESAPDHTIIQRRSFPGRGNSSNCALQEEHPYIMEQIIMLWGSKELRSYLLRLLLADQQLYPPFSPAVASELMLLSRIHLDLYPDPKPSWVFVRST